MAHSFRSLIFNALVCASCLTGHLHAASDQRAPLEFTVFARHRPGGLQFLPDEKSPPQSLEFFGASRSPRYSYQGGASLPIFDAVELTAYWEARTRDPRNPPPLPPPVAVAAIPPDVDRGLLVFSPLAAPGPDGLLFHVYVADDSSRRLPAGHAAVINASGREYLAKMGGQSLAVPPGIGGIVPVRGTVELRLVTTSGDGWLRSGHHTFRLGASDRVTLVFFPPTSPTGIAPIIRTLIETVPDGTASRVANNSR